MTGGRPLVKICGLVRPADAAVAAEAGAAYVGVVFAGGPRLVSPATAREVARAARAAGTPRVVGVFGTASPAEIARVAEEATLDVVQLHADPDAEAVAAVRAAGFGGAVWGVCRLAPGEAPPAQADSLAAAADAILVDAAAPGALGGTGRALDWGTLAPRLEPLRRGRILVLAGGLRPENVARAVAAVRPDVVDVSSGVERRPGEKDPDAVRRFVAAVASPLPVA